MQAHRKIYEFYQQFIEKLDICEDKIDDLLAEL